MTRSVPMSRPANPWIKPARTPYKASLRAGSLASKAITSMWWDYRWRWCTACWASTGHSERLGKQAYVSTHEHWSLVVAANFSKRIEHRAPERKVTRQVYDF